MSLDDKQESGRGNRKGARILPEIRGTPGAPAGTPRQSRACRPGVLDGSVDTDSCRAYAHLGSEL